MPKPTPIRRNPKPNLIWPSTLGTEGEHLVSIFTIFNATTRKIEDTIGLYIPVGSLVNNIGLAHTENNVALDAEDFAQGRIGTGETKRALFAQAQAKLGQNKAIAAQAALGKVINPNVTISFQGVNLRQFTVTYTFIARNEKESRDIDRIIKKFESAALPGVSSLIGEGLSSGVLSFPHRFQIDNINTLYKDAYKLYPQYKECGMTNFSVSPDAGGKIRTFDGTGAPVEYNLVMQFTERYARNRSDVE